MKIGILLKQVPDTETKIKINTDGKGIDENGIRWIMNPYDELAIEEALRIKDKTQCEVVVISAGPARTIEAIRQALAMGSDRGIHIETKTSFTDPAITSILLANAAKKESFDLIFSGKQSVDNDCGQVHIGVAEKLGWPHISPVEKFSFVDEKKITAQRPVSGGTKEIIECDMPVVIGCEKGLNEPRYASLPGIMKAKSKPVETLKAEDLLNGENEILSILKQELPPERKPGKIIEGEPEVAAENLVKILREQAKVI
ncbi:MAG: electron transfer flavoprotein subunit beta [Deltaproteobacteria bacterium CG07_land_8_20_14_0_80_38_7]|nr:MAG: electron transfer flavoprotein subunit beta [Deltaproteobacteria bacterium CG07_land_8_20_14_0_80_38_7]